MRGKRAGERASERASEREIEREIERERKRERERGRERERDERCQGEEHIMTADKYRAKGARGAPRYGTRPH
jgi:hypothetical protein